MVQKRLNYTILIQKSVETKAISSTTGLDDNETVDKNKHFCGEKLTYDGKEGTCAAS